MPVVGIRRERLASGGQINRVSLSHQSSGDTRRPLNLNSVLANHRLSVARASVGINRLFAATRPYGALRQAGKGMLAGDGSAYKWNKCVATLDIGRVQASKKQNGENR